VVAEAETDGEPRLRRSIGITQLALYWLGSLVGSGIYGLMGKAASSAVWLSFLVALFAALLTSFSCASLGSRSTAYVMDRAFGIPVLSFTIRLALVASGLTSIATQSKIFATILADLTGLDVITNGNCHRLSAHSRRDRSAEFARACGSTCSAC
jgi:basic amino acid/polyamine antiporter, APA family